MKKVYILHGWDGSPKEPMHAWLKNELEKNGFTVKAPKMPYPLKPEITSWINKLKKEVDKPDKDTYFIGHSIGCQTILRYLEILEPKIKIGGVLLIAPWINLDENTIKEEGEEAIKIAKPWMENPINWEKIKKKTEKFVCIFSDNDPYVPFSNTKIFKKNLGAKIITESGKGHFTESDNIRENKTAMKELLEMAK